MKSFAFVILLVFASLTLGAQDVVFERENASDTIPPSTGPNRRNYIYPFITAGFIAQPGFDGAKVKIGHLGQWGIGFRYKYKLSKYFGLGFDLSYIVNDYELKKDPTKALPDTILYDEQRLIFNNFELGAYFRINFGRRGNVLGKYIDLGGYGDAVARHTYFTRLTLPDDGTALGGTIVKRRSTGAKYYQKFNYGIQARIGISKWIFYGQYRLSDMFVSSYNFQELPRLTLGIQRVLR